MSSAGRPRSSHRPKAPWRRPKAVNRPGSTSSRPTSSNGRRRGAQKPDELPAETEPKPQPGKKRRGLSGLSVSVKALGVTAFLGMLAFNMVPVAMQWYQQNQEHRAVLAELEATKQRNQELKESLRLWKNEDYIASQAKARLGYVWPGEVQYNVAGLPETPQSGETVEEGRGARRSWTAVLLQSMVDADSPAGTEGLGDIVPTRDPKAPTPTEGDEGE